MKNYEDRNEASVRKQLWLHERIICLTFLCPFLRTFSSIVLPLILPSPFTTKSSYHFRSKSSSITELSSNHNNYFNNSLRLSSSINYFIHIQYCYYVMSWVNSSVRLWRRAVQSVNEIFGVRLTFKGQWKNLCPWIW